MHLALYSSDVSHDKVNLESTLLLIDYNDNLFSPQSYTLLKCYMETSSCRLNNTRYWGLSMFTLKTILEEIVHLFQVAFRCLQLLQQYYIL